jgi:hypothetical protein
MMMMMMMVDDAERRRPQTKAKQKVEPFDSKRRLPAEWKLA